MRTRQAYRRQMDRVSRRLQLLVGPAVAAGMAMPLVADEVSSAAFVPSGSINPHVWSPDQNKYEAGLPSGYAEGETAAMTVHIGNEAGNTCDVDLCLDVNAGGEYAFTHFDAWNRTASKAPTYLPNANGSQGPNVDYGDGSWDKHSSGVWGRYVTINSVSAPAKGQGNCDDTYYMGVSVNFTVASGQNEAWMTFGGRFALPGADLIAGFPDSTVPVGESGSFVNGTFQSRIEGAGSKTVNFKGSDIEQGPADLAVVTTCANFSSPPPYVYESVVSNIGDNIATGVRLVDTLPSGVTYAGFTSTPSGGCSAVGQVVTCDLTDDLAVGGTWTLGISVTVQAPVNTSLANTVEVSGDQPDPVTSNDGDTCASTTAVTIAYAKASAVEDGLIVTCSTATEVGNLGFNIYADTTNGRVRLNDQLIPSNVVDSVVPQHYVYAADALGASSIWIEDIDLFGRAASHGPFPLDVEIGHRPEERRVDVSDVRAEHEAKESERLATRVDAATADDTADELLFGLPGDDAPFGSRGMDVSAELAGAAHTTALLKVDVDGVYRVTADDLRAVGFDWTGMQAKKLALVNRGKPVPIHVVSDRLLDTNGYIEFVGQGLDSIYSRTNVYALSFDPSLAERTELRDVSPTGVDAETTRLHTVRAERDRDYTFAAPGGDPWHDTRFLAFSSPRTWAFEFPIDNLVAGVSANLAIDLGA